MKKLFKHSTRQFIRRARYINRLTRAARPRALPQHFRRQRLLIVGCGDVGMRILRVLQERSRPPKIFALTSQTQRCTELRAAGATPLVANLDQRRTLQRLRGLAAHLLHLAPPANHGTHDTRTRNLLANIPQATKLVYVSTTGVYGNAHGQWISESSRIQPHTARAQRRVAAEQILRTWSKPSTNIQQGLRKKTHTVCILRTPGIYAAERLPTERLRAGTPILNQAEDVYTNHIHADDLARLCWIALFHGRPQRAYNACDDLPLPMGEWMELLADALHIKRPPRLTRSAVQAQVSPMQWSFMTESRRISNQRLNELGFRLQYPTVYQFVHMHWPTP